LNRKNQYISTLDSHLFIKNPLHFSCKGFFVIFLLTMSLAVKGRIDQILKPESGTSKAGKEWSKQEFVIETTEDQYPKKVCFTLFGDKVSLIQGLAGGQEVEVSFNLESREYNGRWFHNINAWKIESAANNNATEPPPEFRMEDIPPEPADNSGSDLPF
jgi:hypothetical protein